MNLSDKLADMLRVDEAHSKALAKLGIATVRDLFYHFPARYDDLSGTTDTTNLVKGSKVTLYGIISKTKASKGWKSKIPMTQATINTVSGKVKAVWFHQPYIAKMFPEGTTVKVEGTVSQRNSDLYLSNPEIAHASVVPEASMPLFAESDPPSPRGFGEAGKATRQQSFASDSHTFATGSLLPVYPESRGVTSRWIYYAVKKLIKGGAFEHVIDPIPADMLKRYNLPTLATALVWIHAPERESEANAARKRFAFEEIFFIQLKKQQERHMTDALPTWDIRPTKESVDGFLSKFPFKPTGAQSKALKDIFTDFAGTRAMSRLLEGDVGSGKTFVAAATSFAVVTTRPQGQDFGNLQVALMAPTEILATQHFESFIELYRPSTSSGQAVPIQVGLITSSGCKKFPSKADPHGWTDISRSQLLKWVANGEIPILIGTHALIQKSVTWKHLAYVIIDEQHRFGTRQRMLLARKSPMVANTRESDANRNLLIDPIVYKDLSYTITNVLFTVQNSLGSGHKEVVYQKAIAEEFNARGIKYEREKALPVFYRNKKVGTYQPDFVVDGKIILELKALPFIGEREKKQVWSYLKGSSYHLALLANMGASKVQILRIVLQTARATNSRSFASHSRSSDSPSAEMLPHLLSMTATPIPRTLALTIYGDLDLTLLDEMPPGRKAIITKNVPPSGRAEVYEHMRVELAARRQAYVICPRIDAPDETDEMALQAKSVEEEARRLAREVFPEFSVGMLHGKMSAKKKEEVMKDFTEGTIKILVATSVVEVGVNVPNATIIVIEGAERFGLSQLHQLRGRVLRSTHQAYCYLFTESKSQPTLDRLKALTKAANGFELAEHDLMLRGAGDLSGRKQWGVSDIGMEALKNLKLVEAARAEAKRLIEMDPNLTSSPLLKKSLEERGEVHFE